MERAFVVAVGGTQGVGKTTALPLIREHLQDVEVIPTSRMLVSHALELGLGDFHVLPPDDKQRVRLAVADAILTSVEVARCRIVVLDWHYMDVREGLVPIQPENLARRVDAFILLEASVETICERRRGDGSRMRTLESSLISEEQEGQLRVARLLASEQGRSLLRVSNEGSPDQVARAISNAIQLLVTPFSNTHDADAE
jgi:adenylate kinase